MKELGPLEPLIGIWEGDQGVDVAPQHGASAAKQTPFREKITFTAIGLVANGPQQLYGLRYSTVAWPLNDPEPFHEEVGYWLWDNDAQLVMRSFVVPRGVVVNAGGTTSADASTFSMSAQVGSEIFGILSNPFLDQAFKTVQYDLSVKIHNANSFSYQEDTVLMIADTTDLFHHTDQNTLSRSS